MPGSDYMARLALLALILAVNAFFAASEVALLSVRDSRLRHLASEGHAGAKMALALLANPGRLLSVTQVGVTLASLGLGWAGEDTLYAILLACLPSDSHGRYFDDSPWRLFCAGVRDDDLLPCSNRRGGSEKRRHREGGQHCGDGCTRADCDLAGDVCVRQYH